MFYFLFFLFLSTLSSCGLNSTEEELPPTEVHEEALPTEDSQASEAAIVPNESEPFQALRVLSKEHFFQDKKDKPYQGRWVRKFLLENPQGQRWAVEKYDLRSQLWFKVGETDSKGVFIDENPVEVTRYRFGGETGSTTEFLPGVLEKQFLQSRVFKSSERIVAKRIVLAKGQRLFLEPGVTLELIADEVVIDGEVLGPSTPKEARSSGHLKILTGRLYGLGKISLGGGKGHTGQKGARGRNGDEQSGASAQQGDPGFPGGTGGRGGNVEVRFAEFSMLSPSQITAPGGPGGSGGQGGDSGRKVYHSRGGIVEFGGVGPTGPSGSVGKAGTVLIDRDPQILEKIFQERMSSTQN